MKIHLSSIEINKAININLSIFLTFFMTLSSLFSQSVSNNSNPQPLRPDITLRAITDVQNNAVRITRDAAGERLYYLLGNGRIYEVEIATGERTRIFTSANHGVGDPLGFTVADDGSFFVLGNQNQDSNTVGILKRYDPQSAAWSTVMQTEPYPLSGQPFDHKMNGMVLSPDENTLFVNSGSRTDHGEMQPNGNVFPEVREVPITSAILRIPADAENLVLYNNLDSLKSGGYLYADGLRNSFDLAFAPNGDLFATENSGDRDDADELNWIREGHHYGFPWRMGSHDTPQQFPGYAPDLDRLVNRSSTAYIRGFFYDDPTYPAPPDGVIFTDPVENIGPDSDKYRDPNVGTTRDASDDDLSVYSFTPHMSPLGLVFDTENALSDEFVGDGFVLGWTDSGSNLFGPFREPGEDLLHLDLNKVPGEDRYRMQVTRLVEGFKNPIDAEMIANRIYVLEFDFGSSQQIWEVTLPSGTTAITGNSNTPGTFELYQNFPNPFNLQTSIQYRIGQSAEVQLRVFNLLGQEIRTLVNEFQSPGIRTVVWDGSDNRGRIVGSGLYVYQLRSGDHRITRKMLLLK